MNGLNLEENFEHFIESKRPYCTSSGYDSGFEQIES